MKYYLEFWIRLRANFPPLCNFVGNHQNCTLFKPLKLQFLSSLPRIMFCFSIYSYLMSACNL